MCILNAGMVIAWALNCVSGIKGARRQILRTGTLVTLRCRMLLHWQRNWWQSIMCLLIMWSGIIMWPGRFVRIPLFIIIQCTPGLHLKRLWHQDRLNIPRGGIRIKTAGGLPILKLHIISYVGRLLMAVSSILTRMDMRLLTGNQLMVSGSTLSLEPVIIWSVRCMCLIKRGHRWLESFRYDNCF